MISPIYGQREGVSPPLTSSIRSCGISLGCSFCELPMFWSVVCLRHSLHGCPVSLDCGSIHRHTPSFCCCNPLAVEEDAPMLGFRVVLRRGLRLARRRVLLLCVPVFGLGHDETTSNHIFLPGGG